MKFTQILIILSLNLYGQLHAQNEPRTYYSKINKLDVFSGNLLQISNARKYLDIIEKSPIELLPKFFGKDSSIYVNDFKFIIENYRWPIAPPWVFNPDERATRLIRTYYKLDEKKVLYQYQIVVNVNPNDQASITFLKNNDFINVNKSINVFYNSNKENQVFYNEFDATKSYGKIFFDAIKTERESVAARDKENYDLALLKIEKCLWYQADNQEYLMLKRDYLFDVHRYEEMLMVCDLMTDRGPVYYAEWSKAQYELGNYSVFVNLFNTSSKKIREEKSLDFFISRAISLAPNTSEILTAYEANPKDYDLDYFAKYDLYLKNNKPLKAEAVQKEFLGQFKPDTYKYNPMDGAVSFFKIGLYAKSEEKARIALKNKKTDNFDNQLMFSQILISNGKYTEAYALTNKLLEMKDLEIPAQLILNEFNIMAAYMAKLPYEKSLKSFNQINEQYNIERSQYFDCDLILKWAQYSKKLNAELKTFLVDIASKTKAAINPMPH